MRGEKSIECFMDAIEPGSSPHARGKGVREVLTCKGYRIIPACAGKSDYEQKGVMID